MISKNKSRFIVSLQKKKAREEEGLFVIEGDKLVREFLEAGAEVRSLVAKKEFIRSLNPAAIDTVGEVIEASFEELRTGFLPEDSPQCTGPCGYSCT